MICTTEQLARMQGEIDAIDTRIDRAWEGIKADLARKEWLRQQIMGRLQYFMAQDATPEGDKPK